MIDSLMRPVNGYGRALEIGSGSGAVSISLAEMGWKVTAIDVNPMAVAATRENSREKGSHEMECMEGSFDEIDSLRDGMFDLIVWNLPYIGIPSDPPSLEVIEETSLIDAGSDGWASELRAYLMGNPSMLSPDGAVVLLYRTYPESPSKPMGWIMDGWATRTISSLYIGGEKLEVIGHWRPGLGEEPLRLGEMPSTMNYEFAGKNRFERVFVDSQTSGRGRRNSEWITDPEGIAATWRLDGMNGLPPGILQIGVGAELSSTLHMHLKWPNDVVDSEYRKCGGVLCKLHNDGSVRIGVGINRHAQDVPEAKTTGWNVSLPNMSKSTAICCADAAVASALDVHPLIGGPDSEELRISAWRTISRVLSRGHRATIDEIDMGVAGIQDNGEILLSAGRETRIVGAVDEVSWQVAI